MVKSPWVHGDLRITRSVLDAIERAAVLAYAKNEEACGYLRGPAGDAFLADEAVELENLANKYHEVDPVGHPRTGHDYFKINALKFQRAVDSGVAEARPVKVFFHSHLDCGAYFSAEDAASMTMGGGEAPTHELAYFVTAIDQGRVSAHKLFIWAVATKSFVEAAYRVVDG